MLDGLVEVAARASSGVLHRAPAVSQRFFGFAQGRRWVDANFVHSTCRHRTCCWSTRTSPTGLPVTNETLDPVGGHIPGALNRFQSDLEEPSGCFLSPDNCAAFRELLGDIDPGLVWHQCGSGVTACHNLLAMDWLACMARVCIRGRG